MEDLGEDGFETFYGSEGYYFGVGGVGAGGNSFSTVGNYIDVRQCKCSGYFAEEGGFLVIRFDQSQVEVGGPDLEGKSGEPGAGADVEGARWRGRREARSRYFAALRMTRFWGSREEVAGQEEGLAEVAGYDFFWMADGGEVDAGVPAK